VSLFYLQDEAEETMGELNAIDVYSKIRISCLRSTKKLFMEQKASLLFYNRLPLAHILNL